MASTSDSRGSGQTRTYDRAESVVFLKTKEEFGGLSNMAGGFPLCVNGIGILTAEALYQACRYPHRPELQRLVIEQASPMTAKMKSKPHRHESRPDWERLRVKIMRWCLRVKLAQNWDAFSSLLRETGNRPIVEQSWKDDFWGAKPVDKCTLVGRNVLGRLLMELREAVKAEDRQSFLRVEALGIPDFRLGGRPIEPVTAQHGEAAASITRPITRPSGGYVERPIRVQASLLDPPTVKEAAPEYWSAGAKGPDFVDLKPYAKMKDSGVPWLGEVPGHWEVSTLRRRLRPYDGIKIGPFGSQLRLDQMSASGYKVYGQANVIARDFARGTRFVDEQKFNELSTCEVRSGDLVVTMMGTSGRCARVPDTAARGIMDSHLLRLRTDASCDATFAAVVVDQAPYVKEQISIAGKGSIMQGLNSGMVKDLVLAFPQLQEQAAIVRFLDHTDRRIRRYIRAKQKLIKLLDEQKQAITHRAVTRGLDPNVRLKPSGVDWLGDVPEHWQVVTMRRVIRRAVDGPHHSPEYFDRGIPFLSARNIKADRWSLDDAKYISESDYAEFCRRVVPEAGDVLYTKGGTTGVARAVDLPFRFQVWVHVAVLKVVKSKVVPEFLAAALNSPRCYEQAQLFTRGATNQDLGLSRMKGIFLSLPSLADQAAILAYLSDATRQIADALDRAHREIQLLREYRTRLIADVVTGKLDVREAAARLPDEFEEPEPVDEVDALADGEVDEADDLDAAPEEAEA